MSKPIVHYVGKAEFNPLNLRTRIVEPMDHPNAALNGERVITSEVVAEWQGHIETRNTRYVPVKLPKSWMSKHAEQQESLV